MQTPLPTLTQRFCDDPSHPQLVRELVPLGEVRRYRKGSILIHEADAGDTLFVVVDGRVKVYCTDDNDKEITFGVIGPGEYFGEMALDGGPRAASVVTLESTVCALLTRNTLLGFIARQPEFALHLLSKVIRRARMATNSARNLAFVDVYGRLSQCLLGLATPQEDGTQKITERLTHQEIASRTGCSREMVSRILKDLENGGYVRIENRQIVLMQPLPARW
ncbi:CRP/FNR family transcriptional regulator, cyclic AMP receptor protein [Rhodoferax sp. OV413]|uniref:Crp/Fnr family transcriptional regulator n=1 Tax=Rhodoferax sp. OV413 TaxID=1855285 RepID=UPI0008836D78|nr:cyclic nucleotide-binding domain-containing protein [Rhodoferax sp. OV413]SDP24129.1 CRP/FNR family transcriptional regulator, cyclic AMP receptor protein [Rhodoferax sp. OV413]